MIAWRRQIRIALALFVVGLGLAVLFGLRERAEPARAVVVERMDPDAVIQTRGSRIVQADSFGDNLRIVADRQLTYSDGGLRMIDGVEITVESRDDREGFTLQGTEASVDADQTEVELTGSVRFAAANGLEAMTDSAFYSQSDGVVRMPGTATFLRDDMEASANSAEYDRTSDLLRLSGDAVVTLTTDDTATVIASHSAAIAETNGFMTFDGGVRIEADARQMTADRAGVTMVDGTSQLEALELHGGARIVGSAPEPGELREMTASDIRLDYDETGQSIERATLDGAAHLELFGAAGRRGTQVAGRSMVVAFTMDGTGVDTLSARDNVVLDIPAADDRPAQRVTADVLRATSESGNGLERAEFEGSVEYRETRRDPETESDTRIARAQRLETTLGDGLSALEGATFHGDVTFEDGQVQARGDQAHYVVVDNTVELILSDPAARIPRVVDRRGSVQARNIRIGFEGPRIDARGDVESVLSQSSVDGTTGDVKRPGLLDGAEPVLVTAGELSYDGELETATYSGGAHLWQGDTEFRGDTIVRDEAAGDLEIDGAARTRFRVTQINDDTGFPEESLTNGRAMSMHYADDLRRVTYATDARLSGPRVDLTADVIEVYLHENSNALDRITASGEVTLVMTGRLASGESLVYYDADGRYEMQGKPVRIVEEDGGGGEKEGQENGADECRETTGRTLTFFITADEVSVDGQAEARTETATGECAELMRR